MKRYFSKSRLPQESIYNTPEWALKKIKEAGRKRLNKLDLSFGFYRFPYYSEQDDEQQDLMHKFEEHARQNELANNLEEQISFVESRRVLSNKNSLKELPPEILELKKLKSLSLSGNQLKALPESIGELQKLTKLDLDQNQFKSLPETTYLLQNLTVLNLSGNQLKTLPESISQLRNLTVLNLSDNQLKTLPESISQLQNLTTLNLKGNQLTGLPESIYQLQKLATFDLSGNQLKTLPESISQLQNLTTLNLKGNQLTGLPESIYQLQKLTTLDLRGNPLTSLSDSIFQLQNLTTLDFRELRLSSVPKSFVELLKNRTELDLSDNQFETLPESIGQLENLNILNLSRNRLKALPESISQLENLTKLDLSENQFDTLPEVVTTLKNLTGLDLGTNRLKILPESISRLSNLRWLNLGANQLSDLPESITQLQNLNWIGLGDNPLVKPPFEVAVKGVTAINEYFRQLGEQGEDHLFEAKLLILGEAGAGKTTFAHKILDSDYILQDEVSTEGVDVLKWTFLVEGNRLFRVNIWDFGGQEIYHATHQFFLTRRSLYTLVADTRKDDTDFYYWLNIAELLSEGSPLLIIKNEKQDRHREINERQLKGQFESLREILATNLKTNRGLEEIKEDIKFYLRRLPHIGSRLPKTWARVRENLEKDLRNTISLEEYLVLCRENGFVETKDSLQLSSYLHDIGVFLHFQDDPLLNKTIILKPKWGTDAVYKVLDNKTVIHNLGRFTRINLEKIWNEREYEVMRNELLQLMMKFKLCYEIPNQRGNYIAPQLLTENQPDYEWNDQENLLLRYTYEFMPKGILTQFIVAMHPYIRGHKIVWKSGVVIEKDRTRGEVIEYYGKREIHVRVAGEQRRDLMTVIRHELKKIHETYKRLKYEELIQCNCPACKNKPESHFYSIAELMDFRTNNQLEIQCRKKPYNMVGVMGLLGDVINLDKLPRNKENPVYNIKNYYAGDKKMTKINQTIKDSSIHGNIVAGKNIRDSINVIEKANVKEELKENLGQLAHAVAEMAQRLPNEQAEETTDLMKRLAEEATKEKPSHRWYNVSIDGLIAAAQNLGKVGDSVIELADKVRKILTGGLF